MQPLPTSSPLLTQMMGTSLARMSRTDARKVRLCCTGTACTAYCAPGNGLHRVSGGAHIGRQGEALRGRGGTRGPQQQQQQHMLKSAIGHKCAADCEPVIDSLGSKMTACVHPAGAGRLLSCCTAGGLCC